MNDMNREVVATTLVAFALSSLLTGKLSLPNDILRSKGSAALSRRCSFL